MTHFDYITKHMLPGWVESWKYNFRIWSDLMTNNYKPYANPWGESPERECYEWFWASINMDETLSKEFLEYLHQKLDDVDKGKVKPIPYTLEEIAKQAKSDNQDP